MNEEMNMDNEKDIQIQRMRDFYLFETESKRLYAEGLPYFKNDYVGWLENKLIRYIDMVKEQKI